MLPKSSHSRWISSPPLRRMAPATPPPRMRSLLAALTMASTSISVRSPCWMMMRSEGGFIGDIVEQVGRAAGIRYQGSERAGSQEDCERQSVRGHLDRKAGG